ncbi:hypothetical protein [Streptosporangium lutulentum]|uniref:Uncharacterized protein n=1 Tax=Streptosporangium lutulentum TaxID=1461250 RepID=A0ABT9QC63_9ACTN|nr:hypothetical protein [Streptosporangium lutulentum]MDP9844358.1 hypothetical protein [Streptosporangium lutulentum]
MPLKPNPLSDEARRELQDWAALMVETRKLEAIMEVLRNPQEPFVYRTLAHKLHLCIYILYQIYDWMLIHQHELVMDILMPFHCPRCAYRIHPPEMLGTPG